jgi:ATP-binding cassette, subfamily B, bacterial MsbA
MKPASLIARLWSGFVARYKLDIALLAPVLAVVALAGASYGLIMKWVTDSIQAENLSAIALAPLAVVGATIVRAAAIWGQALLSQGLALKVLRDLQGAMFAKLMVADYARLAREDGGKLVSRFTNDINVVSEGLVKSAQVLMRDSLTVVGAVASMLWLDWVLTVFVAGVFALAAWPLGRIAKRARERTGAAQTQMGALTALLVESFGAARFIKTYGLEQREAERANAAFEARRKLAMKLVRNRAPAEPLLEIIGGVALAGVLFAAGLRIAGGAMTLGDLLGIITAVGVATPAARSIGAFNTILNEALAALARLFTLLDEPAAVADRPGAKPLAVSRAEIAFDNVSFSYGAGAALSGVSFRVARGETIALVGPSGAGKSTVFNLIPRLYDAAGGAVRIDGQDVREVQLASLRANLALVSQEAALLNDTVRANIALGRLGASDADVLAAARAAAADDFIGGLPNGYDTLVGERGANLSGGQRQRIALARAFLRDAPILLLDEATSALDAESEAKVQEALARLAKGRTTLVIAHRLSTIRDASRILVLDEGRLVETGAHADLVAKGGLYARLVALQFAANETVQLDAPRAKVDGA